MASTDIGRNVRRLRVARDFSQERLAERAGLSRDAYKRIESGRSVPRVGTLQAIAAALSVPLQDLVAPAAELNAVRFRSKKKLRSREQILVEAGRWLRDFNEIEILMEDRVADRVKGLPVSGQPSIRTAVKAAEAARELFGIGSNDPIRDICGLLEAHGVKVGQVPIASHDFFGLSIAPSDGGPAIVVNTYERIPVERWIFTAAHELGHLVLHLADYDVRQTDEADDAEAQANAFAGSFLMPDGAFRKEWEETYGLGFVDRVLKVKRIFRVSYRTVLYRLAQNGVVPNELIWARFQTDYRREYGRTLLREDEPLALAQSEFRASFPESSSADEPERLSRVDFPGDRLSRLVRRAIEGDRISLGRGAEILRRSIQDMRELAATWVG